MSLTKREMTLTSIGGLFSRRTKIVDLDKSVLKRNGLRCLGPRAAHFAESLKDKIKRLRELSNDKKSLANIRSFPIGQRKCENRER